MKRVKRIAVISSALFLCFTTVCLSQNLQLAYRSSLVDARDIIGSARLAEPLISTAPTTDEEDSDLALAVKKYASRSDVDDFSSLQNYVAVHPKSGWSTAVFTNLGLGLFHNGYFSEALTAWDKAVTLGANATSPEAKALVDRAIGERVRLYTALGQFDQVVAVLKNFKDRPFTGSATESIQTAQETLRVSQKDPRHLFLCGPNALKAFLIASGKDQKDVAFLDQFRATPRGTSFSQLTKLATDAKFSTEVISRKVGQPVPVPSIVHWKLGHFATVLKFANGRYQIKDPVFNGSDLWVTAKALDAEASGFFLISEEQSKLSVWQRVSAANARQIWGKGPTNGSAPGDPGDPLASGGGGNGGDDGLGGSGAASGADGGPNGYPPDQNPPDGDNPNNPNCGLCGYNIKEGSVSVTLSDTPVGYSPPIGPSAKVRITYNQREDSQPANFNFYNVSPKWTLNWLAYVTDDPANPGATVSRYMGGGGAYQYSGYSAVSKTFAAQTNDGSILVLVSQSPITYKRLLRDGSAEVYAQSDGAVSFPRRIFLSQKVDPQGNALTLNYDGQFRLTSFIDAVGRQTTFSYDLSPGRPYLVTKITDPFGRFASLSYDGLNRLSSITDALGLKSSFTYDANSLVNSMVTPYGTTTFAYTAPGTSSPPRFVQITDPLGFSEREEWLEPAPIPNSDPASTIPQGMPTPLTNNFLSYRTSFYWDKNAYVVAGCTPTGGCDYTKARARQFNHQGTSNLRSNNIGSVKYPFENRIWFTYDNQPASYQSGAYNQPNAIGRVLDDGTTQITKYSYDPTTFNVTKKIDPRGRVTTFAYANGIDLSAISQSSSFGVQSTIAQFVYNTQHRPILYVDAALQSTRFGYNSAGQITSVTNPLNQTTSYQYDVTNNLASITNANSLTVASYTYDAFNRVRTFTDSEGWSATLDYDLADRPTKVTYLDGTSDIYTYDKLDLSSYKDRQGRTWKFSYDANRRLTSVTDPLTKLTQFGYNRAGRLTSLIDPKANTTSWSYDAQNRLIGKQYADTSTVTYTYETTTSRLKLITDALGQTKQLSYWQDSRFSGIAYLNSVNPTPNVTFADDLFIPRRVSMTDGNGTTQYSYVPIGTKGALRLQQDSSPITTSAITYAYDELGRLASRTVAGAGVESFEYDAIGRLIGHTSDLGSFSLSYLGQTSQTTLRQLLPAGSNLQTSWSYLPNSGDRRLASINNTGLSAGQFTNLQFVTTPEKFISAISETSDSAAVYPVSLTQAASYNSLNQLTNLNVQPFSYDANGDLLSDGLRSYTWDAENRLIKITYPSQSGKQTAFNYDGLGRRTAISSTPAGGGSATITSYLWCGARVCQARNATNATTREYYDEGERIPGSPAQSYYYGIDQLGSVRRSFVSSGSAPAYGYDPYGNALQGTSLLTDFGYAGMFYNPDSGLYLTRHRVYDPQIGRWLSRDPLENKISTQTNLYWYVNGNSIGSKDPLGLWQITVGGGVGFGGAVTVGVNGGQLNVGIYFGFGEGISADYDPHDTGTHACGMNLGVKGSYDILTAGISSNINLQGDNSAAINIPLPSPPLASYNALDPASQGNPTFSAGLGGYVGAGGTFYFRY